MPQHQATLSTEQLLQQILDLQLLQPTAKQQQDSAAAAPYEWQPAHTFDAPRFAREALLWTPDARQDQVLQNIHHKRMILNWGRQCGKSTIMAARILHWAVTHPGQLILVLGGVESHTAELFVQIDAFLAVLDWPSRGQTGKRLSRKLPNKSRIVASTTGRSVRGHAASLIVMDEAAFIAEAVWEGVFPTLAVTGGALMAASTPNGVTGRFYELWNDTGHRYPNWFRSEYKASDNPRIGPEVLEEAVRLRGESYMRQEYLCEFRNDARNLIPRDKLEALFNLRDE